MQRTDEDLLFEISKGDTAAFSEFYDRYSRIIYGALLRLLKSKDDAQDTMQEVFVQVWRKASTYKGTLGPAKNWVVRIAHNRAINLIRSAHRRLQKADIGIPEDDALMASREIELVDDSLLENAIGINRKEIVEIALGSLPHDQAKLLELAFFDGYSHSEISEKLAMPLGTVKTKIRNGIMELRESLAFMGEEYT